MLNLKEIVQRVEGSHLSVQQIEDYLAPYKSDDKMWHNMMEWIREPGGYYRKIGPLLRQLMTKYTCEIGTFSGLSAMIMADYCKIVDSYDISHANIYQPFLLCEDARFHLVDNLYYRKLPYDTFDVIMIDIGNHDSTHENWIHNYLLHTKFFGIALYDDINWGPMKPFWNSITNNKIATDWHDGSSSFGIVEY